LFRMAEARLKENPNDAKGWYLLARARASVGQFEEAMRDYEKLVALTPNDADAWADYADAAAGKAEGKMVGRPLELVNRALAIDPKQPKALLLRGTHEIQINDLVAAEKTFTFAKSVIDPTTGFAQIADNALKDIAARRAGIVGGAPAAAATTDASKSLTPPSLAAITLNLSSEAKKASSNAPNAAVFVIVRAAGQDTGPPLAAKKVPLASLSDAPVALSASDAMIGGAGLAVGTDVSLEARLSIAGQPLAQAGDFRSAKQRVKLGAETKIALQIGEKI
jgi:cytochrome c-type biogenesis protein CcmH